MLILTRKSKASERCGDDKNKASIIIGDDIIITILSVDGVQVRVGIDAPKNVSVHREEIYRKIQKEKLSKIK